MIVNTAIITSPYGNRILNGKKEFHYGIDIISGSGNKKVYSPYSGTVIYDYDDYNDNEKFKKQNTGGNYLIIKHELAGHVFYLKYLHLKYNTLSKLDKVKPGDLIGEYSNYGYSFGEHLHISCYLHDWTSVNPLTILDGLI